ncbi:MAG TPA: copper homeostasis protein CutC, partial [Candidatus Binatia bacterium]|nr:copper homeostasis protein CutC [Candidatus Binatia bacterium]
GRVAIMACGGVNAGNAGEVVQRTGVKEVHAGLRTAVFASSQQEPKRSCAPDSRGRLSLHRLSLQRLSQHMSFDPPEVREADVAELRRAVSPRPV